MAEALAARDYTDRTRYDALMDVVKNRLTTRAFDSGYVMPREHYDMVLEAARHAPSGANAQPWHFIAVTDQELKNRITEYFREEQVARARLPSGPAPQIGGVRRRQLRRHGRGGLRVESQIQHHVARRTFDAPAPVPASMDQVGILAIAMLRAVLLDRRQPGLLDELEQPRSRRGTRARGGVHRALALGSLHHEVEVDANGVRGAPNGRLYTARRGNRTDAHDRTTLAEHG